MFDNLGGGEVLLIFLVILIFFGPKKIPELAGSLGKGLRKFRDAKDGLEDQIKTAMKEPIEALQVAKSSFDQQVMAASQSVDEMKNTINAPVFVQPPIAPPTMPMAPVEEVTPPTPAAPQLP